MLKVKINITVKLREGISKRAWKTDIAKIIIAVSYFSKHFIVDVWQESEYASGSEYPKGSGYASGSEYPRVLNSPIFWICLFSEFARIFDIPEFWICLWYWICHNSEYTRVPNMRGVTQGSEYAWIILIYPSSVFFHSQNF